MQRVKKILLLWLAAALWAAPLWAAPTPTGEMFASNAIADLVAKVGPAVVNIDTESVVTQTVGPRLPRDPLFREFFGDAFREFTRKVPMKGAGSGFVVSGDGRILTNNHVVANADKITVTFSDGKTYEASVIGKDPTFDLAVLKIDAQDLPTLPLGDSDSARVGEWVIAIGNPLGLGVEPTVTVGVLSAKHRTIQARNFSFDGFLQTDAAINPGNSGGPLLNVNGEVIGINSAIIPYAQGIGFAIPVNMAKQVMEDIVTHGRVRRGQLGVYLQTINREMAQAMGLENAEGALVADVMPGSPAEAAGIRRGDVVLSIDGKKVKDSLALSTAVRQRMAGDKVTLEVNRNGRNRTFTVTLGEVDEPVMIGDEELSEKLGFKVTRLTAELRSKLAIPASESGLVITEVTEGSQASRVGLRENDLLLEANRQTLRTVDDLAKVAADAETLVLLVLRDGRSAYVTLRLR